MASEVIKLNLIPKGEMPVFHCSQFDNGRLITIELYRGEDAYEVPEGYTVELHCRKVDNNIVTLASTLVNTNVVTFTSTTQLTACNGKNLCEVSIKAADDYLIGTLNFWLEVEVDPLKGGINSTSEIHNLYEQIEDITAEVIGDDYYNKTEVDNLLDDKADKSTTYTKTQVDTLLTSKADKSNVYTKSETNTLLSAKADADNVYTKAQVETKLAAKADTASVYTKDETDALLDTKANAATTYTKTEVDTALALKANAADVYTKTQVDNIILDIMPVDTAGPSAIANFTTGLTLPLVECEVGIVATGGNGTPDNPNPINGYSSANITRCGVNLFDGTWEIGHRWESDGTYISKPNTNAGTPNKMPCKPNTSYTFVMDNIIQTTFFYLSEFDISENHIQKSDSMRILPSNKTVTFTTGANTYFMAFSLFVETSFTSAEVSKTGVNYPSTDTTYHAYNGQTYAIAFGQTVYGGVLDVTRGKLTVNYIKYELGNLNWTWQNYGTYLFRAPLTSPYKYVSNTQTANMLCPIYQATSYVNAYNGNVDDAITYAFNDGNYCIIRDTSYANDASGAAALKADLNGQYLVYELATPFDIDLTPVQIRALVGENNVFGDTNGNTTVKFKDTIQNYIDKKVST